MSQLREKKRAHRETRKMAKRHSRIARRHHWRCFWTWPLGHCPEGTPGEVYECVACGKRYERD